jgi:hypothetical protein
MLAEHDVVALAVDLPEHALQAGDLGTVVLVHRRGPGSLQVSIEIILP